MHPPLHPMHPPLKFSGIRRSITAIACTAAIVISAGCGDSIRGYDPVSSAHAWVAPAGNIPIMVGASSGDIRLNGTVQTAATTPAAPAAPAPAATAAPATSVPLAPTGGAALEVP
jgi:hypothetical protein